MEEAGSIKIDIPHIRYSFIADMYTLTIGIDNREVLMPDIIEIVFCRCSASTYSVSREASGSTVLNLNITKR